MKHRADQELAERLLNKEEGSRQYQRYGTYRGTHQQLCDFSLVVLKSHHAEIKKAISWTDSEFRIYWMGMIHRQGSKENDLMERMWVNDGWWNLSVL